jgi:hypothetical protein
MVQRLSVVSSSKSTGKWELLEGNVYCTDLLNCISSFYIIADIIELSL